MPTPRIQILYAEIQFDVDGDPALVRYVDAEGCGKIGQPRAVEDSIATLVNEHIGHCQVVHNMYPPTTCQVTYTPPGAVEGQSIRCQREDPHHEGKHEFRW